MVTAIPRLVTTAYCEAATLARFSESDLHSAIDTCDDLSSYLCLPEAWQAYHARFIAKGSGPVRPGVLCNLEGRPNQGIGATTRGALPQEFSLHPKDVDTSGSLAVLALMTSCQVGVYANAHSSLVQEGSLPVTVPSHLSNPSEPAFFRVPGDEGRSAFRHFEPAGQRTFLDNLYNLEFVAYLNTPITEDLPLRKALVRKLHKAGIHFMGQLLTSTKAELGRCHIGKTGIEQLEAFLEASPYGMPLGMRFLFWEPPVFEEEFAEFFQQQISFEIIPKKSLVDKLRRARIFTVAQLVTATERNLRLSGLGQQSINRLKSFLAPYGLALNMKIPWLPGHRA